MGKNKIWLECPVEGRFLCLLPSQVLYAHPVICMKPFCQLHSWLCTPYICSKPVSEGMFLPKTMYMCCCSQFRHFLRCSRDYNNHPYHRQGQNIRSISWKQKNINVGFFRISRRTRRDYELVIFIHTQSSPSYSLIYFWHRNANLVLQYSSRAWP